MFYLRIGNCAAFVAFNSKAAAVRRYETTARHLFQFEQRIEGSIHIADTPRDIHEYPDFVLSVGPKGGIRVEAA